MKKCVIFKKIEVCTPKLKILLIFLILLILPKPKNQTKKSALKKFLVSYGVFTVFTSVKDREIPCEAKNTTQRYNTTLS